MQTSKFRMTLNIKCGLERFGNRKRTVKNFTITTRERNKNNRIRGLHPNRVAKRTKTPPRNSTDQTKLQEGYTWTNR